LHKIFISHSSKDNQSANTLKEYLEAHGHRSFFLDFDPEDGIPAGREWERELYRRVRSCQLMIVICSRASMDSRWCFMEMTHARALGKPLLAIKIDDCNLDGVLADRQAVDLTKDGDKAYERLLNGIAAAGLDPANTFTLDPKRPPYPGLLSFREEDAAIFFGRTDEISQGLELLNRIHHVGEPGFVMVLGASGTGKSSLARAGLVPRLRRDPSKWIVIEPFRPRTQPMQEFKKALVRSGWKDIAETINDRNEENSVLDALVQLRDRSPDPDAKILVVVDQFEELLGGESSSFLKQLRRGAEHPDLPAVILGTMRSDFLDRFQNSAPLLDLDYRVLSLGPMSVEDIREIIEEPAKEKDAEFEAELVTALIEDAGTPNTLPLLAFTLRELWESCSDDGLLTLEEYRDQIGGLHKVIGRAADNVQKSAHITPEQEILLRTAFLAMMRVTDDGKYSRRAVKWNDLPEEVRPLLERFVEARLLVSGTDGAEKVVEVAHERLFDSWEKLRRWINENTEALGLRRDIESAAHTWEETKHKDLLWRGARVSRARELSTNGNMLLDDAGRRFIKASERIEKIRRWSAIAVVSVVLLVVTILGVNGWVAAESARWNQLQAEERAYTAQIQELNSLSAQNFAERERVRTRAATGELTDDEKKALHAIDAKYNEQSKRYKEEAEKLQQLLDAWRKEKNFPARYTFYSLFTLEVLRAESGTSLLIHYGYPDSPAHILVDGGSGNTYKETLKPRLASMRSSDQAVPLTLVVSTQTDFAQMAGLIRLMEDLKEQPPDRREVSIGALWSNGLIPGPPEMASEFIKIAPKSRLVAGANELGIPVNKPFTRMVTAPEAGTARFKPDNYITITVLNPNVKVLRNFADNWLAPWRRKSSNPNILNALNEYDILETFENREVELIPSPMEMAKIESSGEAYRDRSVVNVASMVLMLEAQGKRILLTGDATSDVVLKALAQAGYTDPTGNMDVDILVLPHGGSDRNVSPEFFRLVKASHYIMSADGKFMNPELETFKMLFAARRGDTRPFSIGLTYAPEEYADRYASDEVLNKYPVEELCSLFRREREAGTPFEIVTTQKGQLSFGIDLGPAQSLVDKGVRNSVCGL